ncbi:DOPA 4,5-dioxygenase family protein [Pseudomonas sp. LS44]|uniref:DOPA 4,5-dioxygenase family protein n=1 Tax=Pseudomonas sp. LS44 TaxID=1357074 RepID=UPI00215B7174|nr:DOPA 4,5-dioxygenase family protein [Pseudomonas sp. LS44]UVE17844.1 DOPA 4,5-dioxygenase family protein [Pseudomonas sp. LS44]
MSAPISGYHAHVYFDAQSLEQARDLCAQAAQRFAVSVGRVHQRPVGPHPDWSCQLAFGAELFDQVIPWLMLNRQGLTILVHPLTGDGLRDHRDHALWMGSVRPLDLTVFARPESPAGIP